MNVAEYQINCRASSLSEVLQLGVLLPQMAVAYTAQRNAHKYSKPPLVRLQLMWIISINLYIYIYIYCDEPLLCNGRLSTDVISMATNTENQPITRNG
jgi:hypothetical protein